MKLKRSRMMLGWFVMAPCVVCAQDVRLRLYTARPPEALSIRGVDGEVRWRLCAECAEKSARELSVRASDESGSANFFVTGHYELRPTSGPLFSGSYPAHIERRAGRLFVTVTMPLEEYVAAVLMAESGDFENMESQRAMAVVARTYALRFMGQHAQDGFDFCDTTHCQVFGWKGANAAVRAAVNATHGEVLRFEGKLAQTFYHQNCGGTTAAAREAWPTVTEAYLTFHADTYCAARGVLKWESAIRVADLDRALRAAGLTMPAGWSEIEVVSRSESGRAQRLKLSGGADGSAPISASTFRFAVDRELGWNKIRSDLYDVRNAGEQVVFSGRGSGHGVGMCQAGAEEMAREGNTYREILSFYYPGTQLGATAAAESAKWQKRSSERVELLSTQPDVDAGILPIAERILKEDEEAIGWKAGAGVRLQVYATLDSYRDTTGQPGWVAASTRGRTIRLQPLAELKKRSIVESTLRHEIFHVLVEAKAKAATPLWFREGIVLFFSSPNVTGTAAVSLTDEQIETVLRQSRNRDEVQKAYVAAQSRVAALVQEHGKETVLSWLSGGIPGDVRRTSSGSAVAPQD
ncbi:MAG TPA: SpoIID/LytB domain-containing protein [Candidatus Binatus sp.]|nr:SpoIID/LytB domain-containing protein [Candidatus Binatus sp.]